MSKAISVQAGQIARADATLQLPRVKEEVTVRAERPRGEAAALNEQRTADNIVQILPAEVITSLTNTNIADAVGRLPSVSLERDEGEGKYVQIRGTDPLLSNLTINGIHVPSPESGARNVKLDIIPSDLVGSIEVNKTLSANQEGDAIGGSVNLVTKVPGDKPYVSLNAMGGYTNIVGGRGLDQFAGTVGSRLGSDRKWGVLAGGSYDWNGRGIDDLEPGPDVVDLGQGQTSASFTGPNNVAYRIDASNPDVPTFTVLNGVQVYDPTKFTMSALSVANGRTAQRDFAGGANLARTYSGGGRLGILQFGVKARDARKTNTVDDLAYTPTGARNAMILSRSASS